MNTDKRLKTVFITKDDITSIIQMLNPTKVHGWDGIPFRMIQLCKDSIILPLVQTF